MKVLPEVVIYDVDLTMTLPQGLSGTSGINAIAHSVEALYAEDSNPIVSVLAEQSIAALGRSLPKIAAERRRPRGAFGRAIRRLPRRRLPGLGRHGAAPQALPHAGRPVRPAAFRDPHDRAAACAGLQCACRSQGGGTIARALGVADAAAGISALSRKVGAPQSLRELGMPEAASTRRPIWRSPTHTGTRGRWSARGIRELIARAWAGEEPLVQAA